MKKMIKRITAIAMVAVMMFAMSSMVFAATSHKAALYKNGTYGTSNQAESMGNGAINGALVDESTATITVYLVEDFKAYGIKSNMKSVTVNGTTATMIDSNNNGKYDAFSFSYDVESATFPQKFTASFTIKASLMPINATGDLVIF